MPWNNTQHTGHLGHYYDKDKAGYGNNPLYVMLNMFKRLQRGNSSVSCWGHAQLKARLEETIQTEGFSETFLYYCTHRLQTNQATKQSRSLFASSKLIIEKISKKKQYRIQKVIATSVIKYTSKCSLHYYNSKTSCLSLAVDLPYSCSVKYCLKKRKNFALRVFKKWHILPQKRKKERTCDLK
jgi:hypothetical protein